MSKSLFLRISSILAVGLFAAMPAYAGGGGWFIKPLGLMLGGAMLLTIVLTKLKQTNILSFVIMGYIMASVAGLPETSLDQLDEQAFEGLGFLVDLLDLHLQEIDRLQGDADLGSSRLRVGDGRQLDGGLQRHPKPDVDVLIVELELGVQVQVAHLQFVAAIVDATGHYRWQHEVGRYLEVGDAE